MSLDVPFRISTDVQAQLATVAVCGEIDLGNVTELRSVLEELLAATDGDIVIDLSDVSYLDSCGLHELVTAQGRFAALDRRLVVQRPTAAVLRLFELCDVTELLSMSADGDGWRPTGAHESPADIDS